MLWVEHNKTGKLYEIKYHDIINATNASNDQNMIFYRGEKKDGSGIGYFVRERCEFFERFTYIDIPLWFVVYISFKNWVRGVYKIITLAYPNKVNRLMIDTREYRQFLSDCEEIKKAADIKAV